MEHKQILKQMIDFNKTTFDNTYETFMMLQEQSERMTNTMIEQAAWVPKEGRNAMTEWTKAYKKGQTELKKIVDENFKRAEDFCNIS